VVLMEEEEPVAVDEDFEEDLDFLEVDVEGDELLRASSLVSSVAMASMLSAGGINVSHGKAGEERRGLLGGYICDLARLLQSRIGICE
jgi:hypothetical protein